MKSVKTTAKVTSKKKVKEPKARCAVKHYVLDTNVILHDWKSFLHFEENTVVIPIVVLGEIDSFKKGFEILNNGGIVAIFPEGELTKNGEISEFKRGFEFLAQKSDADVIPFYLHGLYGSRFSKKPDFLFKRRSVSLVFGNVLKNVDTALARKAVMELRFKLI